MKKDQRLGKGIGALLGDKRLTASDNKPEYINSEFKKSYNQTNIADSNEIEIDKIQANPYQPRLSFDHQAIEELAESIKNIGLIQPISLRDLENGKYQIISGERRFRAYQILGKKSIPAFIKKADNKAMLEMAIVENIQRENLDPIEIALSYKRLLEECNLTHEELAQRLGKKRANISNYLRLLHLPANVQHNIKLSLISVGHAKVLLSLDDENTIQELSEQIIKQGLSVRQLEDRIKQLEKKEKIPQKQELPESYYEILEYMGRCFNDKISLKRNASGKGSMTIRFDSDKQMQDFLELLKGQNN